MLKTSSPQKDTSFTDINALLFRLDETPIKTAHFASSSKKLKGKQKLKSGTLKLARGLESVFDNRLISSASETENEIHNLQVHDVMFQELVDEFKQYFIL